MWLQTHLGTFTTAFYSQRIRTYGKNKKSESETPCSASDKTFWKTTGQAVGSVLFLCTRGGESGRTSPGRARHPDKRAPRAGGGDRGDLEAAPARRSRRLPCESGVEHLENWTSSKIYLDKEECEHGKNDIFNTNLLQLPMKAQVADEGVVQDIASVAEHSFQIGYSSAMQTFAEAAAALEAKANVQQ